MQTTTILETQAQEMLTTIQGAMPKRTTAATLRWPPHGFALSNDDEYLATLDYGKCLDETEQTNAIAAEAQGETQRTPTKDGERHTLQRQADGAVSRDAAPED